MESTSYSFIDILISSVLALIMFGIGLSLTPQKFKENLIYPKSLIIGLVMQMVGLPILAFIIAYFSNLPDYMKVGFIILAACPGGTTSGFVTFLFRGNVALSILLTTINSILTVFSIPIVVNIALNFFLHKTTEIYLPFFHTITQIFLLTILPAALGVLVKTTQSDFAGKIQKPLKYIMMLLLGAVYTIKFFAGSHHGGTGITGAEIWIILPSAFIFNIICTFYGLSSGRLFKLNAQDAFTIAIEVTLHNTTLALLVGGSLLNNQDMVKPALIYSLFSFWSALILGLVLKKMKFFGTTANVEVKDEF